MRDLREQTHGAPEERGSDAPSSAAGAPTTEPPAGAPAADQAASSRRLVLALAAVWTAVVALSLGWSLVQLERTASAAARAETRGAFAKDVVYRRWATLHGGVYVPVTEKTPPNPYLAHIPERDLTTPSGRKLTLVNPAYMTRQVHELDQELYGLRGHITSLNPIRPENAPDPWERTALEAFARGPAEVSSIEAIGGRPHLRLMRPMRVDEGCLKCHAAQGYKVGDIRGGISVSVPMAPYQAMVSKTRSALAVGHAAIWALGLLGIGFGGARLRQGLRERDRAEAEVRRYQDGLEALVAQRTAELQRTEDILRDSRNQLQALFDHMLDGFAYHQIVTDAAGKPVDYVFLEVNRAFEKFTGLRRGDMLGRRVTDVHPGIATMDFDWIATYGKVAITGEPIRFERYFAPQQHWYSICAYAPARGYFAVTFANVTERKQAEITLRDREERHRVLFESSQDAIMTMEPPAWGFTSGNPACIAMFGCRDVAHFLSFTPWELSPEQQPDGRASSTKAKELIDQAMAQGRSFFAWTHQRADGEAFPATVLLTRVELQGRVFLQATVRDITAQEQADAALRGSEEKYRALVEMTGTGFLILDAGGKVIDANQEYVRISGHATLAQILGRSVEEWTAPHDLERNARAVQECAVRGFVRDLQVDYRNRAGESTPVEISATVTGSGTEIRILSLCRDITTRRRLEQELRRNQSLAAVGTLACGMAHEINNPVMGIMNYAQLIRDGLPGVNDALAEFAEGIVVETKRVAAIVRSLSVFAVRGASRRVSAQIGDLIESALAAVRVALTQDEITLAVDLPEDLPAVACDPKQIGQVLTALLDNARDALNERYPGYAADKLIRITAREIGPGPGLASGRWVRLTVEDHGQGVSPADREHIFEPFFTTKDRSVGAGSIGKGLGLFVCYALVQEHGGTLSLESEPGRWTRFHLDLPVGAALQA